MRAIVFFPAPGGAAWRMTKRVRTTSSRPCVNTYAREQKKCKVRTPSKIAGNMQGANTIIANNNGPKWQRMNIYKLCVVLYTVPVILTLAPSHSPSACICVRTLHVSCMRASVFAPCIQDGSELQQTQLFRQMISYKAQVPAKRNFL